MTWAKRAVYWRADTASPRHALDGGVCTTTRRVALNVNQIRGYKLASHNLVWGEYGANAARLAACRLAAAATTELYSES